MALFYFVGGTHSVTYFSCRLKYELLPTLPVCDEAGTSCLTQLRGNQATPEASPRQGQRSARICLSCGAHAQASQRCDVVGRNRPSDQDEIS